MTAYYNEIDPYAAQWLRNLIAAGHIASGDVDERSIADIQPDDVRGYDQCHFFAGIAGWSLALRLAGWPDDRSVWTGSCPCQPFSRAGQGRATTDERHLWPDWFRLIRAVRPATIFGEQVEAAIGWGWIDLVCADLGAEGYAARFAVLPACGVGAPHIRQRVWFVADAGCGGDERGGRSGEARGAASSPEGEARERQRGGPAAGTSGATGLVADAGGGRSGLVRGIAGAGCWDDLVWLPCSDGKARPTQPGLFPLAHAGEFRNRVAILRAAGNCIVPPVAAEFIRAACGGVTP